MRKDRPTQAYKLEQYSGRIRAVIKIALLHNAASKKSSDVLKSPQKNVPEVSLKCHQKTKVSRWGIEAKKYHQTTTEIPPEMTVVDGKRRQFQPEKIGSIRVKSGQKIRLKCNQMRPNATRNSPLTYHLLILLNSSFMLCC